MLASCDTRVSFSPSYWGVRSTHTLTLSHEATVPPLDLCCKILGWRLSTRAYQRRDPSVAC